MEDPQQQIANNIEQQFKTRLEDMMDKMCSELQTTWDSYRQHQIPAQILETVLELSDKTKDGIASQMSIYVADIDHQTADSLHEIQATTDDLLLSVLDSMKEQAATLKTYLTCHAETLIKSIDTASATFPQKLHTTAKDNAPAPSNAKLVHNEEYDCLEPYNGSPTQEHDMLCKALLTILEDPFHPMREHDWTADDSKLYDYLEKFKTTMSLDDLRSLTNEKVHKDYVQTPSLKELVLGIPQMKYHTLFLAEFGTMPCLTSSSHSCSTYSN